MSDTGTDSDCTIWVTNNGDIANVDKDFDLSDVSVSSEGTVDLTDFDSLSEFDNNNGDVHVDDNNNTFSNMLKPVNCRTAVCICSVLSKLHTMCFSISKICIY